jgi:Lipocalin-like domain
MSRKAATNRCGASRRRGGHGNLVAVAIVVSIVLSALTATAGGKKPEQAFLGSWRLETFERKTNAGEITYPYGKHPVGQLIYDTQGHMSVLIMDPDRTRFKAETSAAGTTEEKAAAFDTFLAYVGTYQIDETSHTIIHRVDASSYPNFKGSEQRRTYSFADGKLTLTFVNSGNGNGSGPKGSISRLVWVRY